MRTQAEIYEHIVRMVQAGRLQEAESLLEQFMSKYPGDPFALWLMGSLMIDTGRPGTAIALLTASVQIQDQFTPAWNNLAVVLREQGHDDAAEMAYQKVLALTPDDSDALGNYSGFFINAGNPDRALELARRALAIDPNNPHAANHVGLALLEKGDWVNGFRQYRARHNLPDWHNRQYGCPEWNGEHTETLVIHGEQGLGDEVLFMAWFQAASKLANTVLIECAPRLIKLFERSFGVPCYGSEEELLLAGHKPTAYAPMGSLPRVLGMEARSSKWLKADPDLVRMYREKLESLGDGPYIGVSWKGGLSKTHAHLRSSTKADWERIVQNGTVVSLQYGDAQQYADDLGIPHWPEAIADLDHFAALIMALDLVVSVCNTTIHVSGALGIPTWILVPSKPAWRYGLTGDRMPWYPEARMFRQIGNDWSTVYSTVEKRLATYATDYAGISANERREARI